MTIRLLGRFDLQVDGAGLPALESARAESLLAYLLLHSDVAASRQRLAHLLWPDSGESQARTNLRHVVHTLRHRLPDADRYLEITPRNLRWRPDAPYRLDVTAFEQLLAPDGEQDREGALRDAVQMYGGDLLEGCDDEWLLGDRERLRHRQLDALAELAGLCEAGGRTADAVVAAERLLREDPLREQTYRQLMRLHDARGDRARALRVYHACSSTLERELGVEPSAATDATYQALLRRRPDTRPVPDGQVGRPPLVGRGPERARLAAAWRSTEAGRAQFVLVSGEPGLGKTRLAEELREWCARRGAIAAEARCYPAEGALAYGPLVDWLRSAAIRPRLSRLGPERLTEIARLLPELLAELPDLARPAPLPEGDQRHRLFDAVAAALLDAGPPVLLVVDDLQHGDRETCQLLHYLLRIRPEARVLVVATARREEIDGDHPIRGLLAGLHARERLVEIELGPLGRGETAVLAQRLRGAPLEEADAQRLHADAEGNPLFVVEAVRAGWTAGRSPSPRVQAVIEARLAQLSGPARDLVEVAATIGREFGTEVLAAAADVVGDGFLGSLDELWRRRIVRDLGTDTYDFSHGQIREVARLGVAPARRRVLHLRIGTALERLHADGPAQVAAHFDRAGAPAKAITWYRRAAESALLLHANPEAVRLLDRALELVRPLPESVDRDRTELAMLTAKLVPLVSVEAYASPVMSATQQRACDLAHALGIEPAPPLLRSLALSALTRSDFPTATGFGRQLRAAADRDGDDVLVVEAAYVLGIAAFWQADLEMARRQFALAVERYRPQDRSTHLMRYAQDPKVVCLGRLANTLWFLGLPDAALEARAEALAWAEEIGHPLSRAIALTFALLLALDMGDDQDVRGYTAALGVVGQGAVNLHVIAAFRGYVAVLDGDVGGGTAAIRDAVDRTRDGAAAPGQHAFLTRVLLAAHLAAGDTTAALAVADRLLELGGTARVWEPEARRVRAELGQDA